MRDLFSILFILYIGNILPAQNFYIDSTYCNTGSCTIELPGEYSHVEHMSFDSLDNLYIGIGEPLTIGGSQYLVKLNKDGLIDNSFGSNGIFSEQDYEVYQKDNYIFSMKVTGGGTIINVYDLDLNFIQRYILPQESHISNLHHNENYFVGTTYDGSFFKYKPDGTLDTDFAQDGVYNLWQFYTDYSADGYTFGTEDNNHYCILSSVAHDFQTSIINKFNHQGQLIKTIELLPPPDFEFELYYPFNFVTTLLPSSYDNLIVGIDHERQDDFLMQSEFRKIDKAGQLVTAFGHEGSLFAPPSTEWGTTKLVGELKTENLVIYYTDFDLYFPKNEPGFFITDFIIMKPDGTPHLGFGNAGYLNLDNLPGNFIFKARKAINDDHIYITSADDMFAPTLHITKLNLEDLPGTPVTSAIKNNQEENSPTQMLLYPNPTASATSLLYTGPTLREAELQVLDTNGKIYQKLNLNNLKENTNIDLNTAKLSAGLYIVRVTSAELKTLTKKLIVTN